jgi:hypothetical protein
MKWLTSGAHRLKASLNRSFGARKTKKAVVTRRSTSIFASAKVGARERMPNQPIQRMARHRSLLQQELRRQDTLLGAMPHMASMRRYRFACMPVSHGTPGSRRSSMMRINGSVLTPSSALSPSAEGRTTTARDKAEAAGGGPEDR